MCSDVTRLVVLCDAGRGHIFGFAKVFGYELRDEDATFNIQTLGLGLPSDDGFWKVMRNHGTYARPASGRSWPTKLRTFVRLMLMCSDAYSVLVYGT